MKARTRDVTIARTMWGNTLGWCISVGLLIAMVSGVLLLNRPLEMSPPTEFGRDSNNLAALEFTGTSPRAVLAMNDAGDAGSVYRNAIADFDANRGEYDRFSARGTARDIDHLAALKLLLDAAPMSRARIFIDHPAEIVNYDNEHPPLEALKAVGTIAARAGLLAQQAGDAERARRYFEAEFSLGNKLFEERLTAAELLAGMELMSEATAGLRKLADAAHDAYRSRRLAAFDDSRTQLWQTRIMPVLRVLQSADARTIGQHAGDIAYLARNAADRAWRVEAILALGRMKYFVGDTGRVGDQRAAVKYVRELADDSTQDAVIRQAAKAARDLTIEQYRMIH